MANWDNLSTKIEQERTQLEYMEGWEEGYSAPLYPLPAVAYVLPRDWTARQRGYALGWLMQQDKGMMGGGNGETSGQ